MNEEIYREMMFHDDAEVEIRSANDCNEKQIEDIRYFIDNGFDIIIAAPNESGPITPIIREAYERGIPVITFDRDIDGEFYTSHLEVDNYGLGQSAARYALNIVGRPARIIEIQGTDGMTPTQRRHGGFIDEIDKHDDIEVVASVYGNWDVAETAALVDSLLDCHRNIDLIYAHNDRMAVSASNVARRKGFGQIKILGIDGSPEIGLKAVADSVIDATFLYPTDGWRLVRTAMAILKGEPYNREEFIAPMSPIDLSNADILLQQKALQKSEIEKIKILKGELDDFLVKHSSQSMLLYAAIAIVLLFCCLFFMLLRAFWQHKRHQEVLVTQNRLLEDQRDRQKELYQQLDKVTQSKLMFFTNVSHDLRTPLTLIAEPIEQMISNKNLTDDQRSLLLLMANKNVHVLKRLINQILDFRKIESGMMRPVLAEVDFADMVREWIDSFSAIARRRHIKLIDVVEDSPGNTLALDPEKIERVFFNLMSNAFKYTPDNGRIEFRSHNDGSTLEFSVADTGIGIPEADLSHVFERFFQGEKVYANGSGIGLSLTKAFVELHGGTISVVSEYGKGSVFIVRIPVRHVDNVWSGPVIPINQKEIDAELDLEDVRMDVVDVDDKKETVLVIDDSLDLQELIRGILSSEYNVITAADGRAGVHKAAKYVPDLIICDVMMPVMDGLECCRIIKGEMSTSHIPVLMLTACSLDEQRVAGYDSGADGYLAKPFNGKVLLSRCRNLIENRKRISNIYQNVSVPYNNHTNVQHAETSGDIDNEFYLRFVTIVNEMMGDVNLNIEHLAGCMGLGQSQFSRKIKSLTNYNPVELIRVLRLKKARMLLTTTEKTMGEIAYAVGFSSPAYFSKCFKDAYGETPSDLRSRLSK